MSDGRGRFFGGIAALAVLWIFVYWWWEPRGGTISFDPGPPAGDVVLSPAPGPRPVDLGERPIVREPEAGNVPDPRGTRPTPAVIPPEFREYTIRDGDTLEGIARRELGSARHVEAIRAANPLMSPENLRIGRPIRLPLDVANIQGRPNPSAANQAEPEPPSAVAEYTVKSGDTLSKIAKEFYGSTGYDEFIYLANRDRLASKDELKLGQKLRLPPKEER